MFTSSVYSALSYSTGHSSYVVGVFLSPVKALCLHTSITALKSRRETRYSLYLPPTQHFGPRRCTFPSKGSIYTWGTEFIALELFVPTSSISIPLLFKVSWKRARSSWLFFESLSPPHFLGLFFPLTWCSDVPHAYSSFVFTFCSFTKQNVKWSMLSLAQFSLGLFFPPN